MTELNVLIASGVRHAHDYIDLLREMPGVALVGVAEESDAQPWAIDDSRSLAQACALAFLDMDEGLAKADAVVVCSEPTRHAAIARRAIAAGRHVLIDKPAAVNRAEFDLLIQEAAQHSSLVVTSVHRLLSPAIVRARKIIDSGGIGLPLSVDLEWVASGGLDGSTVERPELVCDRRLSGGGELTNFGWYPILALRHLTGLEVRSVAGFAGALFGGPHGQFGVEDTAVLSVGLDHDATATLTVTRVPAGVSNEPVSSTGHVLGSHGYLAIDESLPDVRVRRLGESTPVRRRIAEPAGIAALRGCFSEFFDAIRDSAPLTLSMTDIAHALRFLDAARAAVASGRTIELA